MFVGDCFRHAKLTKEFRYIWVPYIFVHVNAHDDLFAGFCPFLE